jgi:hypothetical protein
MNANEVIEAYVTDVAVQLPRKQRNDVAFELRALINEGLQDRADANGRVVDGALAIEFLQSFGRPEDVAARYRPTLTIIDPADGRAFLRATIIGLAIIWSAGLLRMLQQPIASGSDFLLALGRWWGATLIPSMWWPGVLVVGFGIASWARIRSPQVGQWKPRDGDRIVGGRAAVVMGLIGMAFGLYLLINPHWVLDFFWNGKAAPAAYQALTYTDSFWRHQAPILFALIALNIPVYVIAIAKGRWSTLLRNLELAIGLASCAAMVWTVLDGPVFMVRASDQMIKLSMVLIVVFMLIGMGVRQHRSVRPRPNQQQPQA